MRQHHDIGGLPAGPVDRAECDYAYWERRVDAMLRVLGRHGVLTVDELRRGIETLAPATYDGEGYYARWDPLADEDPDRARRADARRGRHPGRQAAPSGRR